MSSKKYFAIRYKNGKTLIKRDTWDNVKPLVERKSGVVFKGFMSSQDAEEWLNRCKVPYVYEDGFMKRDHIYLFVDGSYSTRRKCSGWGWVCVKNNMKQAEGFGVIDDENMLESRNIVGELKATMEAVSWASKWYRDFTVVHDYMGISSWALGLWNANKRISRLYTDYMQKKMKERKISFIKVSGHKGIEWNEYADELTRKGYSRNERSI